MYQRRDHLSLLLNTSKAQELRTSYLQSDIQQKESFLACHFLWQDTVMAIMYATVEFLHIWENCNH